jgi:hypothetical protein
MTIEHDSSLFDFNLLVQKTSELSFLQSFGAASDADSVTSTECPVTGHWMGLILLAGAEFRLTLKANYLTRDALGFAEKKFNKARTKIDPKIAHDMVREFLNQFGGTLKRLFAGRDIQVGLSLPLQTRSFDEAFINPKMMGDVIRKRWRLAFEKSELRMTSEVQVLDWNFVKSLPKPPEPEAPQEDDMEFL